ncbi:MAG: class I SAM-dependent methyltransferase [Deltaproteobacteria bacterium]|nr:class I SAM-dependent methyltransferase [Deltaproteobacteria bacterium]
MIAPRIPETIGAIVGGDHAEAYDRMQAALREKGLLETEELVRSGVAEGGVLEVGSGPGHLGLSWLERTRDTRLAGIDRSPHMARLAARHAAEAGLAARARYVCGDAGAAPFADGAFDAVFSCRSLHEWSDPGATLVELWRVLRRGGRLYLSDLRRDLSPPARRFLERRMTSDIVRRGLAASLAAAYTAAEVAAVLRATPFGAVTVTETPLGLHVAAARAE